MKLLAFVFSQEDTSPQPIPPPSCLSDASVLLVAVLRYTEEQSAVALLKVEPLLHVWSHLIMDWKAWEDEEDESVFDAIEEAVALQVRHKALLFIFCSGIAGILALFVNWTSPVLRSVRSYCGCIGY